MRQDQRDISSAHKPAQQYNRSVYQCMEDDVWLTLEIPEDYKGAPNTTSDPVID